MGYNMESKENFMIKNLIKAAAELDHAGFHVEADIMDKIMQKVAEDLGDDDSEGHEEEDSDFGFLNHDESDEEYEEESEEDSEEESEALSAEECLHHCMSLSNEEKVELIKSLLDSMMD
jgi:hypothetical protein